MREVVTYIAAEVQSGFPLDALGDVDIGLDAVIAKGVGAGGAVDGRTTFATEDAVGDTRSARGQPGSLGGPNSRCAAHRHLVRGRYGHGGVQIHGHGGGCRGGYRGALAWW